MKIIDALKFTQGAVSKKEFIPALTHFRIEGGHIRSFNGTLALSCPIAIDLDCIPKAEPLIKAIEQCDETVTLSLTKGRLNVKSGKFKASIPCFTEDDTPHVYPTGTEMQIDGEALIKGLKVCAPFMADDASQAWAMGVCLGNQSMYATNNIAAVEYWVGSTMPHCIIPRPCVSELLRIHDAPYKVQVERTSITFHYEGERWLRTQVVDADYPDFDTLLNVESNQKPIDEKIFEGLVKIKPFLDKMAHVYFFNGLMSSVSNTYEGANYELGDDTMEGIYHHGTLLKLKGVAHTIDFSKYPKPSPFFGERLRGVIVGMLEAI